MSILDEINKCAGCWIFFDPVAGITIDTSGGPGSFTVASPYGNAQPPGTTTFTVLGVNNQSSGVALMNSFSPVVNQTATAGYTGLDINVTETAIGSGSNLLLNLRRGGTSVYSVSRTGVVSASGTGINGAGNATSTAQAVKAVPAIADNTATAVLLITIPNSAQSAVVEMTIVGALGAGGAVGAFEASATIKGAVVVARFAGIVATVTAATATLSTSAVVTGGATITLAYAVSVTTGGAAVTNVATVTATISHGSGGSTNHTAIVSYNVINSQASGVTAA